MVNIKPGVPNKVIGVIDCFFGITEIECWVTLLTYVFLLKKNKSREKHFFIIIIRFLVISFYCHKCRRNLTMIVKETLITKQEESYEISFSLLSQEQQDSSFLYHE